MLGVAKDQVQQSSRLLHRHIRQRPVEKDAPVQQEHTSGSSLLGARRWSPICPRSFSTITVFRLDSGTNGWLHMYLMYVAVPTVAEQVCHACYTACVKPAAACAWHTSKCTIKTYPVRPLFRPNLGCWTVQYMYPYQR